MKQRLYHKGVLGVVALVAVLVLIPCLPRPVSAVEEQWPRRFQDSKGEVVMYQPQLEDFKDDRLTGRAAVSAKRKEWRAPYSARSGWMPVSRWTGIHARQKSMKSR